MQHRHAGGRSKRLSLKEVAATILQEGLLPLFQARA